ncbi:unnamed protein product [Phaeothamnion confervicola]
MCNAFAVPISRCDGNIFLMLLPDIRCDLWEPTCRRALKFSSLCNHLPLGRYWFAHCCRNCRRRCFRCCHRRYQVASGALADMHQLVERAFNALQPQHRAWRAPADPPPGAAVIAAGSSIIDSPAAPKEVEDFVDAAETWLGLYRGIVRFVLSRQAEFPSVTPPASGEASEGEDSGGGDVPSGGSGTTAARGGNDDVDFVPSQPGQDASDPGARPKGHAMPEWLSVLIARYEHEHAHSTSPPCHRSLDLHGGNGNGESGDATDRGGDGIGGGGGSGGDLGGGGGGGGASSGAFSGGVAEGTPQPWQGGDDALQLSPPSSHSRETSPALLALRLPPRSPPRSPPRAGDAVAAGIGGAQAPPRPPATRGTDFPIDNLAVFSRFLALLLFHRLPHPMTDAERGALALLVGASDDGSGAAVAAVAHQPDVSAPARGVRPYGYWTTRFWRFLRGLTELKRCPGQKEADLQWVLAVRAPPRPVSALPSPSLPPGPAAFEPCSERRGGCHAQGGAVVGGIMDGAIPPVPEGG